MLFLLKLCINVIYQIICDVLKVNKLYFFINFVCFKTFYGIILFIQTMGMLRHKWVGIMEKESTLYNKILLLTYSFILLFFFYKITSNEN